MRIKRLRLKKLNNARDIGGLPTADGRVIKRGKLIRSDKLSDLPESTVAEIKNLGVTTIVDLRVPTEKIKHPDIIIEGINYVFLPVLYTATYGITNESSSRRTAINEGRRIKREFGSVDNYMVEVYRSIVFNEQPQNELKKFLRLVIEEEGTILWHCSSGKDRAGICAMLVESLLGVPEEIILEDYIASRRFWRRRYALNRFVIFVVPMSLRFKSILFGFMRTKIKYLKAVIDEMKTRYGSVAEYCKQVLEITDEDINLLKTKYLE